MFIAPISLDVSGARSSVLQLYSVVKEEMPFVLKWQMCRSLGDKGVNTVGDVEKSGW
jgi:hypothetical protein